VKGKYFNPLSFLNAPFLIFSRKTLILERDKIRNSAAKLPELLPERFLFEPALKKKTEKSVVRPPVRKKGAVVKKAKKKSVKSSEPALDIEILPAEDNVKVPSPTKRTARPVGKTRDIAPYDPVGAYLREISRFKPLTREEEHELAVSYYKNKDVEAAYKLISSNLWLVVKLARDYEKAARSLLDLVQEGNMGLMEAVKNFDPYRGVRFPSYAVWWVKAYIVRFVLANWRLVRIGTTQAQRKLFFNLKKEKDKLEREGFYPSPKLLAEKLDVKETEVVEMEQRMGASDLSVDAPLSSDSESNFHSLLPSPELSAEDLLARKEIKSLVHEGFEAFMGTLNDNEQVVFSERMLSEDKVTLQQIAEKLSISGERVRQIENRLKDKLKAFFTEKFGTSVDKMDFDF